jgi:hypothetical protein
MERLFGAIPTESHAAPTPSLSASPIQEEGRAWRFFACLYARKILGRKELCDCMRDRREQGVRRTPAAQGTPFKSRGGQLTGRIDWPNRYCAIRVIAFEYLIQRLKFV